MTHGQSYKSHDTWTLIQVTWYMDTHKSNMIHGHSYKSRYMDTHANHMIHGHSYKSHDKG